MGLSEYLAKFVEKADNKSLTTGWIFTLVLLSLATLGTWNFIPMIFNDPVLGIMMLFGGILMVLETVFEEGFDYRDKSDVIGLTTATFSLLYGIGLISQNSFFQTHFGGVQGGVLLFLVMNLVWEGVGNRS